MDVMYHSYLSTGSGSQDITLTFAHDAQGQIVVKTNWMGEGKNHYLFRCRHHVVSETYGILFVTSVHKNEQEIDFSPLGTRPACEYIITGESKVFIHEDDALSGLDRLGYGTWNETFNLILFLNTFVEIALDEIENENLSILFRQLDKLKFKKN